MYLINIQYVEWRWLCVLDIHCHSSYWILIAIPRTGYWAPFDVLDIDCHSTYWIFTAIRCTGYLPRHASDRAVTVRLLIGNIWLVKIVQGTLCLQQVLLHYGLGTQVPDMGGLASGRASDPASTTVRPPHVRLIIARPPLRQRKRQQWLKNDSTCRWGIL